jgi:hypothetical protein
VQVFCIFHSPGLSLFAIMAATIMKLLGMESALDDLKRMNKRQVGLRFTKRQETGLDSFKIFLPFLSRSTTKSSTSA